MTAPPPEFARFTRVDFRNFKAFHVFTIHIRQFNILVGPNNAGKSTVLAAFRILAAAMRRASARKPTRIPGPNGQVIGHAVDMATISVAEENIFFNYDDSAPATVRFHLSNGNHLTLFFPEQGACYLIADAQGKSTATPTAFRQHFNCPIGFVPILGPVEHMEPLYEREAARLALFSYRAARNFRNIWYHFPERFQEFRAVLSETWPGMNIEAPEVDYSHERPRLHMFCPEQRIPRELFWAGFGFQVWCQMLTHLIQSRDAALFLIDEPDIYLHSELQRQLLALLRELGPDILIATHSTEIISEAETDDIVLVNKRRKSARRIKRPSDLGEVFTTLGSNLNPLLTQLAKTRRALFVEGKDFQVFGRFARKLGLTAVANRSQFAVIPVDGFNPERVRNIKLGIETTLGGKIKAVAILDKDYRSEPECRFIEESFSDGTLFARVHKRKEVENFLLVPEAIDRAALRKVGEQNRRSERKKVYEDCAQWVLDRYTAERKSHVMAQYLAYRRRFERANSPSVEEATVNEAALGEFESCWQAPYEVVSGKEALARLNAHLQESYGVSVTPTSIIDSMRNEEIPGEMCELLGELSRFASPTAGKRDAE